MMGYRQDTVKPDSIRELVNRGTAITKIAEELGVAPSTLSLQLKTNRTRAWMEQRAAQLLNELYLEAPAAKTPPAAVKPAANAFAVVRGNLDTLKILGHAAEAMGVKFAVFLDQ